MAWAICFCCWHQRAVRPFVAASLVAFAVCGMALASAASFRATHSALRAALAANVGPQAIGDAPSDPVIVAGTLDADASVTESGVRLILRVTRIVVDGRSHDAGGGVLLTVVGDAAPATVEGWRRGRTLRLPAQLRRPSRYLDPGVPDQELALARRGTTLVGTVKSAMLVHVVSRGSRLAEAASEARSRIRRQLETTVGHYSGRSAAIATAILLGDRAGLDEETETRLQEAGTYHVIAISGGNIAILAGFLIGLARLTGAGPSVSHAAVAAMLAAYAYLVGGGSSVERATQMAVIYLVSHAIDHRARPLNAAACSAGVSASADPLMLFDAGAWLTYGATIAILIGTPPLVARVAGFAPRWRWLKVPAGLFAASCAAEIALFPVSAMAFSRVTAAGLLLNFAAIPLMTVVQAAAMAVLAAAVLAPATAPVFALATHLAAWGLIESGRLVEFMPWAVARLPAPAIGVAAAYYAGWIAAWALANVTRARAVPGGATRRARHAALAVAACAGTWILVAPQTRFARTALLEITFLDVGQGAATLVRFPSGHAMLIDAGGAGTGRFDIGRRVVEPAIWASGVHQLSYFVATHGDGDHIGGAASVVADLRPGEVWEGVPVPPEPLLQQLQAFDARAGGTWRTVQRGDALRFGDVAVSVRHPAVPDWERQRVRNDDSVVVELRMGVVSVMVTGDIEAAAEADLARIVEPAGIRVLLAPHHGSATSSTWPLLRAAAPNLAIISAGRGNRYGHPHRAVLERYRNAGARILRTDRDGAITLRTDGRTVTVRTFRGGSLTLRPSVRPDRAPPA